MASPNFPSTGLVPNVTTFNVGDIRYLWDGEKWNTITADLSASKISVESNSNVQEYFDSILADGEITPEDKDDLRDAVRNISKDAALDSEERFWGGNFVGTFEDGFTYTSESDVARGQDDLYYSYTGPSEFPVVVTSGTVANDSPELYSIKYLNLKPFNNISEMINTPLLINAVGSRVEWLGYYSRSDGGSNWGIIKRGVHIEDGGSIFSLSTEVYIEANLKRRVTSLKFGGKVDDSNFDNAPAINKILNLDLPLRLPKGESYLLTPIEYFKSDTIVNYFSSNYNNSLPSVDIEGYGTEISIIRTELDSISGGALININSNPNNLLTDAYIFNSSISKFSVVGSGKLTSNTVGFRLRGLWHGGFDKVKIKDFYDNIEIDGEGLSGSDDHDTVSFFDFKNVSLIRAGNNGFSALKTRPSGLNFYNCEFRDNSNTGYEGGGAGINFYGGSISVNGNSVTSGGGIRIKKPLSRAMPRGFNFKGTTFEANHEYEIQIDNLSSGNIDNVIFTPYENPSWSSTTKSVLKVFEPDGVDGVVNFNMVGARINQWATSGQPISFVRTNSNFGELHVRENSTIFAGGSTQENMQRYVFNSLDNRGWKVKTDRNVTLTSGTDIANITSGDNFFASNDDQITPLLIVDDDNTFSYNGVGGWSIIKDNLYTINITLPIVGLSALHSGIVLDIRVNGVQRSSISRTLPLDNGQYDVPIQLSTSLMLSKNDSITYNCRISDSDINPVSLRREGYVFSISS